MRVYPQIIPTIRLGGQLTKAVYQYTLQAPDTAELYRWAPILFDRMRTLPGLQDVNTDLQISSPQITVDIDRDQAAARDVTVDQIENALGAAYGSKQVSTIYTPSNQYWVILEVDPEYQRDATALDRLYLRSARGALVPLASVAKLTPGVGLLWFAVALSADPLLVPHAVVLGGAMKANGMASFAPVLDANKAEAVRAFVIAQANAARQRDAAR